MFIVFCIILLRTAAVADPISKPYIAYRTSPFDTTPSIITPLDKHNFLEELATPIHSMLNKCASPWNITIKHSVPVSKSQISSPVIAKPVIYPQHSVGPNKSILFLHFREVMDMINFGNLDHQEDSFPILFQGSTFLASPIITDANLDGTEDAILVDYNGIITSIGLGTSSSQNENDQYQRHRFFREKDIPKLYVQKDWVKNAWNTTTSVGELDPKPNINPIHSYFEYSSEWSSSHNTNMFVRGERADIIHQSIHLVNNIEKAKQRRLEEESSNDEMSSSVDTVQDFPDYHNSKYYSEQQQQQEKEKDIEDDIDSSSVVENYYLYDDDYFRKFGESSYNEAQRHFFYKDENYIPLPPHVLSTPALFHVKQDHHSDFMHTKYDEYLAIAVSYYFDEDDHHHYSDDSHKNMTEAIRGQYMSTAIVIYDIQQNSFTQEIHLDLSTDFTAPLPSTTDIEDENPQWNDENYNGFISLALASPTPVDLDGDGKIEILLGTSMGRIYCVCATLGDQIFSVQMSGRIEKPIVVDDLLYGEGNEHLEILAIDSLANIICLTNLGVKIWTKPLVPDGIVANSTSEIILTDVNGDGNIDIVVSVITEKYLQLHALHPKDGSSLDGYPKEFQIESEFTLEYGLLSPTVASSTIIQAVGSTLYVFDTTVDCIYDYDLGDIILSLVSGDADSDDGLDIIATTPSGIVSLDTAILLETSKIGTVTLHVDTSSRTWRNFRGFKIPVKFSIVDSGAGNRNVNKTYKIEMVVAKSSSEVIFRNEYMQHGSYSEHVPFPFPPGFYSITIRLRSDGKLIEETIHFGFHVDTPLLVVFKWMILIPLFLTLVLIFSLRPRSINESTFNDNDSLPSHIHLD